MRRDDWLLHQLPVGMAEDDFLFRFVSIFQRVADTVVHQIDTLPHMFDPTVAPEPMVQTMATWLGVDWLDSSLDGRLQRRIVLDYADLIQWRGTKRGLQQLLELLSGAPAEVRDSGGVFPEGESPAAPPHVRLDVESAGWNSVADLVRIIRDELPATVTFDLWIAGERVWPNDEQFAARTGQLPLAAPPWRPFSGESDDPVGRNNDDGADRWLRSPAPNAGIRPNSCRSDGRRRSSVHTVTIRCSGSRRTCRPPPRGPTAIRRCAVSQALAVATGSAARCVRRAAN